MKKQNKQLHCKRCGHNWTQKGQNQPISCPKCKSGYWNKPYIERKEK